MYNNCFEQKILTEPIFLTFQSTAWFPHPTFENSKTMSGTSVIRLLEEFLFISDKMKHENSKYDLISHQKL